MSRLKANNVQPARADASPARLPRRKESEPCGTSAFASDVDPEDAKASVAVRPRVPHGIEN